LETIQPVFPAAGTPGQPEPPGGVYLCQVGETVSCGACCGLYNLSDPGRERLEQMLAARTERFRGTPRTPDAIAAFQTEMEPAEPRPFSDFYHCPFIGLIGDGGRRAGCLLHPLAEGNAGVDYRGLSFYGGLACREYFCPSCRSLPPAYKTLVQAACDDWYLYGLAVTEDRLLSAFFGEVERRLGRPLPADPGRLRPEAVTAVAEFLRLKVDWPFRGPGWKGPAHYLFNDGLHPRPAVDYARLGVQRSPHDQVLQELETCPRSPAELEDAEGRIERLVGLVAAALQP
jgi:hypothetical protein